MKDKKLIRFGIPKEKKWVWFEADTGTGSTALALQVKAIESIQISNNDSGNFGILIVRTISGKEYSFKMNGGFDLDWLFSQVKKLSGEQPPYDIGSELYEDWEMTISCHHEEKRRQQPEISRRG